MFEPSSLPGLEPLRDGLISALCIKPSVISGGVHRGILFEPSQRLSPHSHNACGCLLNLLGATAASRACSTGRVPECQEAGGPACSPGGCAHLASLKAICPNCRDGHVGAGWVAGSHTSQYLWAQDP